MRYQPGLLLDPLTPPRLASATRAAAAAVGRRCGGLSPSTASRSRSSIGHAQQYKRDWQLARSACSAPGPRSARCYFHPLSARHITAVHVAEKPHSGRWPRAASGWGAEGAAAARNAPWASLRPNPNPAGISAYSSLILPPPQGFAELLSTSAAAAAAGGARAEGAPLLGRAASAAALLSRGSSGAAGLPAPCWQLGAARGYAQLGGRMPKAGYKPPAEMQRAMQVRGLLLMCQSWPICLAINAPGLGLWLATPYMKPATCSWSAPSCSSCCWDVPPSLPPMHPSLPATCADAAVHGLLQPAGCCCFVTPQAND